MIKNMTMPLKWTSPCHHQVHSPLVPIIMSSNSPSLPHMCWYEPWVEETSTLARDRRA
jgi:hypothetical protein